MTSKRSINSTGIRNDFSVYLHYVDKHLNARKDKGFMSGMGRSDHTCMY
jgi:hypothetical protein